MKHKFIKKLFFFTTAITMVSLSFFSPYANQASADDTTTHTLTIKNETMNNKSGEFTYKIKISGWSTLFEDKISSFLRSDGRICGAYLENENDINSTKIEDKLGEEYFNYWFDLRVFEDGQLNYLEFFEYLDGWFGDGNGVYEISPDYIGGTLNDISYCWNFNETTERLSVQVYNHLDLSPYGGIYVPDEYVPSEDYYIFTLSSNESKTIPVPEGYDYDIEQLTSDGWQLISINGDETTTEVSGAMGSNDITYTFLNKKLVDDDEDDPTIPTTPTTPTDPTITVPDTGQNPTSSFSTAKTGIAAFAIIATTSRILYLIRRHQKSRMKL